VRHDPRGEKGSSGLGSKSEHQKGVEGKSGKEKKEKKLRVNAKVVRGGGLLIASEGKKRGGNVILWGKKGNHKKMSGRQQRM